MLISWYLNDSNDTKNYMAHLCTSLSCLIFYFHRWGPTLEMRYSSVFQRHPYRIWPLRILDFRSLVHGLVFLLGSGLRKETSGRLGLWTASFIDFFTMSWGNIYSLGSLWKQVGIVAFGVRNLSSVLSEIKETLKAGRESVVDV